MLLTPVVVSFQNAEVRVIVDIRRRWVLYAVMRQFFFCPPIVGTAHDEYVNIVLKMEILAGLLQK